jgi:hypothetical protein
VADSTAPLDSPPDGDAASMDDTTSTRDVAGDTTGPDVTETSTPWSPRLLPGLVLWLDGSYGLTPASGGPIWSDQSGQHNDAIVATGAPVVRPDAIGGRPALHFNGAPDYMVVPDSSSLQFSTGDFLIALVAAHTTPTIGAWGYGLLYGKQELTPKYAGPALVANTTARTGQLQAQVLLDAPSLVMTTGTYNDGQPFYLAMHRVVDNVGVTATLDLRVNGAEAGSITGPGVALDVSAAGQPLFLGGTPNAQCMVGDLAEVVAIKGAVPDVEINALEAYFRAKYGL